MATITNVERVFPQVTGSQSEMTWSMLDYCRSVLLVKCEDLDDDELKQRAIAASNLTLLGLVRHMTKVEHYWFQRCFLGSDEGPIYSTGEHPRADFDDLEAVPISNVVLKYSQVCGDSRNVVATHHLDELAKQARDGVNVTLGYIGVHMIHEYARHLGHADLLRESLDGSVGN